MLIRSIIERKMGTTVELDGVVYHFKADEKFNGKHVLDVRNKRHVSTFLRVSEGYEPYIDDVDEDGDEDPANAVIVPGDGKTTPIAAMQAPRGIVPGPELRDDGTPQLPRQFPRQLPEDDSDDAPGPNPGGPQTVPTASGGTRSTVDEEHDPATDPLFDGERTLDEGGPQMPDDRAELVKLYEEIVGRKPHHALGVARLKSEINEAREMMKGRG